MCYHLLTCHHSHLLGWLWHGFSLHCNLLMRCCLSLRHLSIMLPLVALPLQLPQLVVASPLAGPLMPLGMLTSASQQAGTSPCASATTSHLPLVKNTPPAPNRLFFWKLDAKGWVDKNGSNAWVLVGWYVVSHPPAPAAKNQVTNHISASA